MPHSLLHEVVSQVTSALRDTRVVEHSESTESADPLVEKKRLRHLLHVYCYLSSLGTSHHSTIYIYVSIHNTDASTSAMSQRDE